MLVHCWLHTLVTPNVTSCPVDKTYKSENHPESVHDVFLRVQYKYKSYKSEFNTNTNPSLIQIIQIRVQYKYQSYVGSLLVTHTDRPMSRPGGQLNKSEMVDDSENNAKSGNIYKGFVIKIS